MFCFSYVTNYRTRVYPRFLKRSRSLSIRIYNYCDSYNGSNNNNPRPLYNVVVYDGNVGAFDLLFRSARRPKKYSITF